MKRQWEPEELIEQFILIPVEMALLPEDVTNANPSNRLGFAVLLKFFQVEARFPQHPVEVPKAVVHFIAQQLKLTEEDYRRYRGAASVAATKCNKRSAASKIPKIGDSFISLAYIFGDSFFPPHQRCFKKSDSRREATPTQIPKLSTRHRFNRQSLSHDQPKNAVGIDVSVDQRRQRP